MPIDKELDIAQQNRESTIGRLIPSGSTEKKEPDRESMVERISRQHGYKKTMDAGRSLQDKYREKKGLDQYNRPTRRASRR